MRRIQKLVRVPTGSQRTGFRFAVAHHAADQQIGVVEGRAVSVHQRIPQLAAFVDGTRRLRRDVAGDAAGERELLEQPLHALGILADIGIRLGVSSFQVRVSHQTRSAMTRPGYINNVEIEFLDQPVEMNVDEIQAGRGAPMAQQPRLNVLQRKRLAQQRVIVEINLADGEIIRGAPIRVYLLQFFGGQRLVRSRHLHRLSQYRTLPRYRYDHNSLIGP